MAAKLEFRTFTPPPKKTKFLAPSLPNMAVRTTIFNRIN
ncbi:hypothetical protein CCACVL1_22610 [Corchorus capsularis]|uniref:Uncharacterized protein n=1 Tax=Corchorus capsularis TaxID=210143 RepID=A0A1R3GXV2_COCAP|nr:hypothetical protein CCACVL1_22610 [Corchorus capsularis]